MNRLLFEKTGEAIYISHLDLMAMFPRIFLRAGLHVKFTQGMSPHAYVSIALPLSVGASSRCELLDFTLEEENVEIASLPQRLNPYFPAGIRVLAAYDSPRKVKELRYLQCELTLEYDRGYAAETVTALEELFARPALMVEKKTKKGMAETDIRPMILEMAVQPLNANEIRLETVICAQNPALNPQYLIQAIERYLPDCAPDFARAHRVEVFDEARSVFR